MALDLQWLSIDSAQEMHTGYVYERVNRTPLLDTESEPRRMKSSQYSGYVSKKG